MSVLSPTCFIALVVVQNDDGKFLLVDEKKDRGWYLPAGRVEPHETLAHGATREVLEETGIEVQLTGVLRIEHTPYFQSAARLRVVYCASPIGGSIKTEPDKESNGAGWFSLDEMADLRLRADEVVAHCGYLHREKPVFPLSMLTFEGAPYDES